MIHINSLAFVAKEFYIGKALEKKAPILYNYFMTIL
jgi:hypothetical protein